MVGRFVDVRLMRQKKHGFKLFLCGKLGTTKMLDSEFIERLLKWLERALNKPRQILMSKTEIPKMIANSEFADGAKKILAGAAEMFALKGYAATSVRQIAEAAEMSVPMVYYYFPGKEDVFKALMEVVMNHVETELVRTFPQGGTLRDQLVHVLDFHVRLGMENPKMVAMMMSTMLGPQEGRPEFPMHEQYEDHIQGIAHLFESQKLRPGMKPRFLATQFLGLKNHVMISCTALEDSRIAHYHDEIRENFSPAGIALMVDQFLFGALDPQGQR